MEKQLIIELDSPAVQHLINADKQLGQLIRQNGRYELTLRQDYFEALVYAILGQQLSVTVANVLRHRLQSLCQVITPNTLLSCTDESLTAIGLSRPKTAYIKHLSQYIEEGRLTLTALDRLPDAQVIEQLTCIKGIGRWTAEMFLIFSLGRLNVFSKGDLGLQRAIKWLYELEPGPSDADLDRLTALWNPYCTVASLYLWEIINQKLIQRGIPKQ